MIKSTKILGFLLISSLLAFLALGMLFSNSASASDSLAVHKTEQADVHQQDSHQQVEIGRASCRERV